MQCSYCEKNSVIYSTEDGSSTALSVVLLRIMDTTTQCTGMGKKVQTICRPPSPR